MDTSLVPWVDALAGTISRLALVLLILVNGVFALAVVRTRSRHIVNRWTKPVVIADAALVAALVGAPVAAATVELGARGVQAVLGMPTAAVTAASTKP